MESIERRHLGQRRERGKGKWIDVAEGFLKEVVGKLRTELFLGFFATHKLAFLVLRDSNQFSGSICAYLFFFFYYRTM